MATKKPRKTIGNNPLDEIGLADAAVMNERPKTRARLAMKKAVIDEAPSTASPATKAAASVSPVKSARQSAVRKTAKPAAPAAAASVPTPPRPESDSINAIGSAAPGSARPDSRATPMTAEELFAAECGAAVRSRRRELAVVKSPGDTRHDQAMAIVKNWSQWSVAAGVVPVPLLDTVAISGVQLKMVHALCKHYGVKFEKEAVLAIVASLVGGAVTTSLTDTFTHMVLKSIPFAEQILQPTLSFATTYSLGYVFVKHFENNGTLKDFKAGEMKGFFHDQIENAKSLFSLRKTKAVG